MKQEKLLMTPGPTMLPPRVLEALGRQIIYHRTKEFEQVFTQLDENLRYVFQTRNPVMIFSSSGTGAMESTIVNLFSPGEKVLVLSTGQYGDRYAEIAAQFGLIVEKLSYAWGEAIDVSQVQQKLSEDSAHAIKAIIMTHNETSTAVTNDVCAVAKLTKDTERLLIVDAISSLGGIDLKMDTWGVDAVVTGSQNALMAPPGLSFVSLSEKAWDACRKAKLPRFYWDYRKYKESLSKENTENSPYTPAISLMMAQAEALKMIREEGLSNVFQRHQQLAFATQEGILSLGLSLLPKREVSSHIITAVRAPAQMDIKKARSLLHTEYAIMITDTQVNLKGAIFRIGHCGFVNRFDLIKTFTALEYILNELEYPFDMGISVTTVQKYAK